MDEGAQQAMMQKENCIFCQIAEGRIPSKKVYENEAVIGVLDINPANAGHVLLLPKEHYIFMPQVPPTTMEKLAEAAKHISHATLKALKTEGSTLFIANGGIAGQKAPHFMMHIIPRLTGDGLQLQIPESSIAEEVQRQVKKQLQEALAPYGAKLIHAEKTEAAESSKPAQQPEQKAKADLDAITSLLTGQEPGEEE
ncbi:HIT domain-containing protein [Candidatus Woesearchaeota archaeon]|nr:HIT domain-containing protein [Candidatus Woesearchaeota archaeon]